MIVIVSMALVGLLLYYINKNRDNPQSEVDQNDYSARIEQQINEEAKNGEVSQSTKFTAIQTYIIDKRYDDALTLLNEIKPDEQISQISINYTYITIYEALNRPDEIKRYAAELLDLTLDSFNKNVTDSPELYLDRAVLADKAQEYDVAKDLYQKFLDNFENTTDDSILHFVEDAKSALERIERAN